MNRATRALAALVMIVPLCAHAGEPAGASPTNEAVPTNQTAPLLALADDPQGMDFNLMGDQPSATAPQVGPEFDAKVRRRRTMLQWHQGLGFALLGSLAATVVVGQLRFNDQFTGGGDTGKYNTPHLALAATTTALFAGVALLGVLAPEPYEKHMGWDSATIHKSAMLVATVGMVTQVVLGIVATNKKGQLDERSWATAHQVVGYATTGVITVGVLAYAF